MFFYEGYVCPVCKQKFQDFEDVVACPDCGAPHHRHCWNQEGHCQYFNDHGTTHQWKRPEESSPQSDNKKIEPEFSTSGQVRTCSRCGKVNPEFAEFCSRCGMGLKPPDWSSESSGNSQSHTSGSKNRGANFPGGYGEYTPFRMPIMDPFGGVPHDEKIDNITAEDLANYVGTNSAYYLPRFYKLSRNGSRTSWNWSAFLFTPYWLLYRKNYLAGGIILFLSLVQTLLNSFILGYFIQPQMDMSSETAMFDSLYSLIQSGELTLYFSIISLMFLINILVRILFGLLGNWIYKQNAVTRIRRIAGKTGFDKIQNVTQNTSAVADYRRELGVQGGVSLILVAVASGIVWFGQMLYQALIMNIIN